MILVFEMVAVATGHASTNSAVIQTVAFGFPHQSVRVFADQSHLTELQSDEVLCGQPNISFRPVSISSHYRFRTHIVSFRRGFHEFWTMLRGIRTAPASEPCLLILTLATPTAIFAASLLAGLMRRKIRVQVVLHGNLNDAFGWRTRNPVKRIIDLHAALTSRHGGRIRFLVLENSIRRALVRRLPVTADRVDVLHHPISPVEVEAAKPSRLLTPLRIGLVGQATESKGITPFLTMAREFRRTHPNKVCFRLVGNAPMGANQSAFAVLNEPIPTLHISRAEFLEKLQALHYVCLLLQPSYYELSASGALMDAVIWRRPVIATRTPIVADLFNRFGDIGELCDDLEEVRAVITRLVDTPDPQRYDRQVANLTRIQTSRLPANLAADYARNIDAWFPGLLTNQHIAAPMIPSCG